MDNYFGFIELNDVVKIGQIAIILLEGTTYNWFAGMVALSNGPGYEASSLLNSNLLIMLSKPDKL